MAADEIFWIAQTIEAQNCSDLGFGDIGASDLTISFYVKSNVVGKYTVYLYTQDPNRYITRTYTIDNAGYWERKIIHVPGDTGGNAINHDNGIGLKIYWYLLAGSDYTSADSRAWASHSSNGTAYGHEVNIATSTSNYWQLTGVQVERGSNATEFENRSFGEELALCQRYCVVYGANEARHLGCASAYNATNVNLSLHLPVPMRTKPTPIKVTGDSSNVIQVYVGATGHLSDPTISNVSDHGTNHNSMRLYVQSAASGLTAGQALWCHTVPNAKLILNAEL